MTKHDLAQKVSTAPMSGNLALESGCFVLSTTTATIIHGDQFLCGCPFCTSAILLLMFCSIPCTQLMYPACGHVSDLISPHKCTAFVEVPTTDPATLPLCQPLCLHFPCSAPRSVHLMPLKTPTSPPRFPVLTHHQSHSFT